MALTTFTGQCKALGKSEAGGKAASKAASKATSKAEAPAAKKRGRPKKEKPPPEEADETEAVEEEVVAAAEAEDGASVPEVGARYFVPAALWPNEKPTKTKYGKGWLASVVAGKKKSKKSDEVVNFLCDGEEEAVSMALATFTGECKAIGGKA